MDSKPHIAFLSYIDEFLLLKDAVESFKMTFKFYVNLISVVLLGSSDCK